MELPSLYFTMVVESITPTHANMHACAHTNTHTHTHTTHTHTQHTHTHNTHTHTERYWWIISDCRKKITGKESKIAEKCTDYESMITKKGINK